jgi:hypothetical protein
MSVMGGPGWLGPLEVDPAPVSLQVANFVVDLAGLLRD